MRGCAGPGCSKGPGWRSTLAQGFHGVRRAVLGLAPARATLLPWLLAAGFALALPAQSAAPCDALVLQPLAPGLWLVPARGSESDADNRGHTSHVLLARDGPRLWAVGSGPTPVFGQRLRCSAQRQLGRAPTDLLQVWARAELTLGVRGLAPRRHWAHAVVAAAMAEQCERCVERLRQRLGLAAVDLGDDPVRQPARLLRGERGRLGPFDWWLLARADGRFVTVLRHRASGVMTAPGLAWGDGPPDARDADLALLHAALQRLLQLGPVGTRWVGDSGPLLDPAALRQQAEYLQALRAAARAAVARGELGLQPPELALSAAASAHPRHALNWQHAWREAEDDWLRAGQR